MKKKHSIIKGDKVIVISGNYKGTTGEVIEIHKNSELVKVQGVRLQTHYSKGDGVATGGLNKKEGWIHISNVSHMTESGKSTKVRRVRSENGVNIFSKKTNEPVRIKKEKTISKVKLEEDTVKKEKEKIKKDKFTLENKEKDKSFHSNVKSKKGEK